MRFSKRGILTFGLGVVLAGLSGGGFYVSRIYRASQDVPDFYQKAIAIEVANPEELTRQFQAEVQSLKNQFATGGRWEARFKSDEINYWLANQLKLEYPRLVPKGTQEPRIAIEGNRILAAAKYEDKGFSAVISLVFEVELTDQPNVIAIRASELMAGSLKLPIESFKSRIEWAANRGGVQLEWMEQGDDPTPVALVTIPSQHPGYAFGEIYLDHLEISDGEIHLTGVTQLGDWSVADRDDVMIRLAGPVHHRSTSTRQE